MASNRKTVAVVCHSAAICTQGSVIIPVRTRKGREQKFRQRGEFARRSHRSPGEVAGVVPVVSADGSGVGTAVFLDREHCRSSPWELRRPSGSRPVVTPLTSSTNGTGQNRRMAVNTWSSEADTLVGSYVAVRRRSHARRGRHCLLRGRSRSATPGRLFDIEGGERGFDV